MNQEEAPEGALELVPLRIREIIPEEITGGNMSFGGLWVSIPDGIFKKEYLRKMFSILFPDLIEKFSSNLEF